MERYWLRHGETSDVSWEAAVAARNTRLKIAVEPREIA
jgi:hypothetical protein